MRESVSRPPSDDGRTQALPVDPQPNDTVDTPGGRSTRLNANPTDTVDHPDRTGAYDPTQTTVQDPTQVPVGVSSTIPGFAIEDELGRGGMGVVYRARQTALDRTVALKMILAGASAPPDVLERFAAEARAVARLQHPNIVQIYEVGEAGGLPYIALEFVPGGTLSKKVSKEPQAPKFAAETVAAIARAMQYAHEKGVIHRDLKPANILLAADGTPKVSDFGLAKRLEGDSGMTRSGAVVGTPSYMAPEQAVAAHDQIGPAADTYALGAILYDLLTGRPPFAGTSVWDTLEMVRSQEPAPPSHLAAKVPADLETICLKCLQKEPAKRYASAGELAEDLTRYLTGRPILARPVTTVERTWRWAKRNPWVAGLGTGVAALLLTVAVVSSVLSWKLSLRTKEAENNFAAAEKERKEAVVAREKETKAKEEALAAKEEEQKARAVTAEQRVMALDVVRKVLIRIDNLMRSSPELFKSREEIVKQALEEVDKIRDHAEKNPLADRAEAIAYQRLGDIYLKSNKVQEAKKQIDLADAIFARLKKEDPTNPLYLRNLAGNLNYQADVAKRLGDTVGARDLMARALNLRKEWLALDERPASIHSVAQSHDLLGRVELQLGNPAAAVPHFRELVAGLKGVKPYDEVNQNGLDRELLNAVKALADAELHAGKVAEAKAGYETALKSQEALLNRLNRHPIIARDLALTRLAWGDFLLMVEKDTTRAWDAYRAAFSTFETTHNARSGDYGARRDLAAAQYRLGVVASLLPALKGGKEVAAKHFADCLVIREALAAIDKYDTQSGIELLLIYGRVGPQSKAVKVADQLLALPGNDPRILFMVSCGFALASSGPDAELAKTCRDRAFQTLTRLVDAGWKDRFALERDPDLDPIRTDPRFAPLLGRNAPK